jgi:hypothetical protein
MPTRQRLRAVEVLAIGAGALALRLPAFAADRHFHPDDGTYGMSALAMRDGAVPFDDFFSSQGPLHLSLVYAGDLLTGRAANSPRAMAVAAGVAAAVLGALVGSRLGDRRGGWIAGVILATSGSMLWTSGPLTADAPTIAFALAALLAAYRYHERPTGPRGLLVGAFAGAALMCKVAVAMLGLVPALVLLLRRPRGSRRWPHAVGAAAAAAGIGLALTLPFGAGRVWDQAIRYQLHTQRERSIPGNAVKVVTTLWSRDLVVLAVLALCAVAFWRGVAAPAARWYAWWTGSMVAFLVVQPALWRNHLSHLVAPVALLAAASLGRYRPSRRTQRAFLGAIAGVAALQTWFLGSILWPSPYGGPEREAAADLRALPPGARAVSDEVGLVWRAGRQTPDDLVDMSIKQFQQDRIDLAQLDAAARRPDVCAFLVWSRRHLGAVNGLPEALTAAGYTRADRYRGSGGARVLWLKPECAP